VSAKKRRLAEKRQNRERALKIKNCLEIIAPVSVSPDDDPDLPENYQIHRDDIEPLVSAIREGRLDLLKLALSARHCATPPDTQDTRIMHGDGPEEEKTAARLRKEKADHEFRHSKERLEEAAKWAAFLFVNGWCVQVGADARDWNKGDIVEFLEASYPEVAAAIPNPSNKKAHAAFWDAVGEEIPQSRGWQPGPVKRKIKDIKAAIKKRQAQG
jgi:hypothetical protein